MSSTLAAETLSMSEALAEVEWIRGLIEELCNPLFCINESNRRFRHRGLLVANLTQEHSSEFKQVLFVTRSPYMITPVARLQARLQTECLQ